MLGGGLPIDTGWHPLADGVQPEWADGWGWDGFGVFTEVVVGSAELRLRWCPPGRFLMGSPEDEPGRWDAEGPQVEITHANGFWMMDAPVTQALWQEVMGNNPSRFVWPDRPVEQVSWHDCRDFAQRLNARVERLSLRLPSESEWEYACRAGTETATYAGPIEILEERNAPVLHEIAWYGGNSGVDFDLDNGWDSSDWTQKQFDHQKSGTRRVRQKLPNPWGLYDMLGNVLEWCADSWSKHHDGADPNGAARQASSQDMARVIRGGSWFGNARRVRAACRLRVGPDERYGDLGLRLARGQV